jgi:hypothetical protein
MNPGRAHRAALLGDDDVPDDPAERVAREFPLLLASILKFIDAARAQAREDAH